MDRFFELALPAAYAGVMFLLGMSLSMRDFKDIFQQPRAVLIGLAAQVLLLPALAFLMVLLIPMPDTFKVGFVLLAACPGGSTSNLASYMLRGNVALSISLTAVNSFIVVLSVPAVMALASRLLHSGEGPISLPFWDTFTNILLLVVLPCFLGLLVREKWTPLAAKLESVLKYVMPALLAGAILGIAFFGNGGGPSAGIDEYLAALPAALLLNVSSMVLGYLLGWAARLANRDRFTIGIEVGIQNSALAITIASSPIFLNNTAMAVPAIVYLLFPFFTAIIFGYLANRRNLKGVFFKGAGKAHKP